jgi:hypothetical protein
VLPIATSAITGVLGVVINIVNFVNVAVMVTCTLYGIPKFKTMIMNWRGKIVFTDTCENTESDGASIIPKWDLDKEIKHRIWHTFWNSVLFKYCSKEVSDRLREIQEKTSEYGFKRVKEHFEYTPEMANWRQFVYSIEGVDVYYDGVSHDGHLDSETKFGKMWISPYPFLAVMVRAYH